MSGKALPNNEVGQGEINLRIILFQHICVGNSVKARPKQQLNLVRNELMMVPVCSGVPGTSKLRYSVRVVKHIWFLFTSNTLIQFNVKDKTNYFRIEGGFS